ncbi:MAG: tetratricopeptide repeat protein, partial [Rhizobiales bacterium]|nr:tetratricopeptide repeat protein [Hyphomicrobiales bacterium]
ELRLQNQAHWLDRLETEHDNIRAALGWAIAGGRAEPALRLAGALWRFWETRGHLREGDRWLAAALALGDDAPAPLRAKALNAAGNLARDLRDDTRATALHSASLALHRAIGDQVGVSKALSNLGEVARDGGRYDEARAFYEQSLALKRQSRDDWGIALVLHNLGEVSRDSGRVAAARDYYEQSLALKRQLGDRRCKDGILPRFGSRPPPRPCRAAAERHEPNRPECHTLRALAVDRAVMHRSW